MVKMINKWGNAFQCEESKVAKYLKLGAKKVKNPKPKKESK